MCLSEFLDEIHRLCNPYEELKLIREYVDEKNDLMMEATIKHDSKDKYSINYPALTNEEANAIESLLLKENYPNEFIPLVDKLYNYIGPEFMVFCAINLQNINLEKDKKFKYKKFGFKSNYISGAYIPDENKIVYYEKETLPHEFLHMSATPLHKKNEDEYYSGFRFDYGKIAYQKGLNEGYTELLTNRIFNDENYDNDSYYKPIVYILRTFELLYADKKFMERDYFLGNYQSPISNFCNYGSIEEYFTLMRFLDYFIETSILGDEDLQIFDFIKRILERTYDEEKILKAEEIKEEYLESEKKREQKIFSLFK